MVSPFIFQVVALGVYVYFFLSLFAYQTVETINLGSNYDTYFVPGGLVLEFIIYYGWFKVAEVLLTPYGTDVGYNYDMIGVFALQLEVIIFLIIFDGVSNLELLIYDFRITVFNSFNFLVCLKWVFEL